MRRTAVLVPLLSVLLGCKHDQVLPEPDAAPAVTVQVASAVPPPSPVDQVRKRATLPAAMKFVKPYEGDQKMSGHSTATALVVAWSVDRMQWADVAVTTDETGFALARKDVETERGKRLCVSGSIVEISTEKLEGGAKIYEGLLSSYAGNLYSFFAVGSSGALVATSDARFCGVLVDLFDYENSAGGVGHAVDLVGMFDLAQNKAPRGSAPINVNSLPKSN